MKRRLLGILICVVVVFGITGCSLKKEDSFSSNVNKTEEILYNKESLKKISEHGEYIIALSEETTMTDTYSVYKNVDYYDYKKIWDFPVSDNTGIESHNIIWNEKNVYIFGYGICAYDIDNGKESYTLTTNLTPVDNDVAGRLDRILGYDNKYIYYTYSSSASTKQYYGRITMDLSNVEVINKSDVPDDLNK